MSSVEGVCKAPPVRLAVAMESFCFSPNLLNVELPIWGCSHHYINPFTPKFKKYILPTFTEKCISEVVRIGSIIIFHLSKQ